MAENYKTNVCCLDLGQNCIGYLKSLGLAVYNGSLGSVLSFDWHKNGLYRAVIKPDYNIPENAHEYHVIIGDTTGAVQKEYDKSRNVIKKINSSKQRIMICEQPVTSLDLQPFGGYILSNRLKQSPDQRRIKIVFLGPYSEVTYYSDAIQYHDPNQIGTFSNYDLWSVLNGNSKVGERVKLEDNKISKSLFEGRTSRVKYYQTFLIPTMWVEDEKVMDPHFTPLLKNENEECISYIYYHEEKGLEVVLPQVEDKAALLKSLFENILFEYCSDFFPDIEAKRWIYQPIYQSLEESHVRELMTAKKETYEREIAELEIQAEDASKKNLFMKQLLTGTGGQLVQAVKTYLEWLGFTDVIDKDGTLDENEIKEEDLDLNFNGQLVLLEVKGINGTSTDAECSQIDKVVARRMKQLKTTEVHGVYVVNNQKNVEPLSRQVPPFNENQISDAQNQDRTLIYTAQLFALYSDVENGYLTKEEVRSCFLKPGVADFHTSLKSLGKPYKTFSKNSVICIELAGEKISVGDMLYYKDNLQRLVGIKVESIEQDNKPICQADNGKTGIKVSQKVPNNAVIYCKRKTANETDTRLGDAPEN